MDMSCDGEGTSDATHGDKARGSRGTTGPSEGWDA